MNLPKLNRTSALQLFQIIRYVAIFIISVAMVKLALPVEQIGQYEMLLFLTNLLSTFWITGMIQALLPIYPAGNQHKTPALFNAFMLMLALAVVAGGVAMLLKSVLLRSNGITWFPYYNLFVVYLVLSPSTLLVEYVYLLKNRTRAMVSYGAISYGLQMLLVAAPLLYSVDVKLSILGLLVITIVRLVWLVVLVVKNSQLRFDPKFMQQHVKHGLPLALKYLVSNSAIYVDQIIVTSNFDQSMFAIYRFGARDIPLVTLMVFGLSNSMLADFRENVGQALVTLKKESLRLMHLLFPISILAIILSKPLFPLLFSATYAQSASIFMLYCLLITSRAILPQTITMGLLHNGVALAISLVELLLNIALSILLVKPFGVEGIALATVLVNIVEKMLFVLYNKVKLKIPMCTYVPIKPYVLYCLLTLIIYIVFRFVVLCS